MPDERYILPRQLQWMASVISAAVALIVLAVLKNFIAGIATFVVATILVNVAMMKFRDMHRRR